MSELFRRSAFPQQPVVYKLTCNGQFFGYYGQIVYAEPAGSLQFFLLYVYFSACIFGVEAYHKTIGVGPWLRAEIFNVPYRKSRFLCYFPLNGMLKRLSRFHEASNKSVEIAAEVVGAYQEYLVTLVYKAYHCRGKLRPYLLVAFVADL